MLLNVTKKGMLNNQIFVFITRRSQLTISFLSGDKNKHLIDKYTKLRCHIR
jgi:hypothetical protein